MAQVDSERHTERNDMQNSKAKLLGLVFVAASLSLGPQTAGAQYEQGHEHHQDFYNGAYSSGRGGNYNQGQDYGYGQRGYNNGANEGRGYNNYRNDNRGYNNGGYNDRGHGIGTGKGAAIGGAGGALLGAVFGGGLKGAIIGGAAGAGIGAIAGHAHQESQQRNEYERR